MNPSPVGRNKVARRFTSFSALLGRKRPAAGQSGSKATSRKNLSLEQLEDRVLMDTALVQSASAQFVDKLYSDLLHRPAQPAEQSFWLGVVDAGIGRDKIAEVFLESNEYRTQVIDHD